MIVVFDPLDVLLDYQGKGKSSKNMGKKFVTGIPPWGPWIDRSLLGPPEVSFYWFASKSLG